MGCRRCVGELAPNPCKKCEQPARLPPSNRSGARLPPSNRSGAMVKCVGCQSLVASTESYKHYIACPHGPCGCTEAINTGCSFIGPPRELLMEIEYTHFRQVGVRPPLYFFERALADLAVRCGRMVPEVKGVRTERSADSEMAWLVTCVVRGSGISPASEEFTIDVMEHTWLDGMIRVSQEALARLAFLHPEVVAGTGYQYLGQRDLVGKPVAGAPHADTAHQLHHLEYLLHHTQTQQDRARERCDLQEDEIATLRAQLAAAQADLASERKLRFAARRRVTRLKAKVTSLEALTAQMEATIEELEDDGEDLRKENEALLSDDDDYEDEDFDMEPDTEDEAFINDEDEEPEPLMPEEDPEEDPEEPPFDEGAPPAPEGPVVDLDDY
ncbi:hypothetical protein QYE76_009858 [Lolium multiflorum]|uniref:Uncharacterized protein n=1 Tax=Lolium multiflorum TaxID=4521 RepID=A0AAD8TTW9_LOLMU|nr:hypothetical protein QYE76_009858 [Lolium multiflorum]